MAKKKKTIKSRKNDYHKLKSFLWAQQKERGVYEYKSKNFNTLVSDVYKQIDKKYSQKNKKVITLLFDETENTLFAVPENPEPSQIEYFNIDRELSKYKEDNFYQAYDIVTNFGGAYPDFQINLFDYDYEGSIFQEMVTAADKMRFDRQMKQTPERKLIVAVDHKNQTIKIYVADQAPPKGRGGDKNKNTKKAPVGKTPQSIEKSEKELSKNADKLNEINSRIKNNELIISKIANSGKEFIKEASQFLSELKQLKNERESLANENKKIKNYLSDKQGFGVPKKPNKKSTSKKTKGASPKRKRK